MIVIRILFDLVLALWWARVGLQVAAVAEVPMRGLVALLAAGAALWLARGPMRRAGDPRQMLARGFLALGISFGLGGLVMAAGAMMGGEAAARAASGGMNPFSAIFGVPLAPILAGNLMAGLVLAGAAAAAAVSLLLAALFGARWPGKGR